jgi:non-catalytic primase subunit PriX-like protein
LQGIKTAIDNETLIKENLDFILVHFANPLFPRNIMTKALGHQKEVFDSQEAFSYFRASNYEDCRINAYPSYTEYQGINLTAPSFIMIDLDLKDFQSQEMLDKTLYKTLSKINKVFREAHPTVLWTGGGYHIYQPIHGFVLEEIDRFACYKDPSKKDLTSRFMQFAENYFTDKKSDSQHRPSVKSCLIRIPGTTNSKYNQKVEIVQSLDGVRPSIQYVLRDYRTWLVAQKINDKLKEKRSWSYKSSKSTHHNRTSIIPWIEKLLQTPIEDHRKYSLWRIVFPYLFNIRKMSESEVDSIVRTWLDNCAKLRPLDFNPNYLIRQNVTNRSKYRYLPISFEKLRTENNGLYDIISRIS